MTLRRGRDMAIELKAWRAANGLAQWQAAERLGVHTQQIIDWESGRPVPFPHLVEAAIGMPTAPVRFQQ